MLNPVSSPCEDITIVSLLIEAAGRIVEAKGPETINRSCAFAPWCGGTLYASRRPLYHLWHRGCGAEHCHRINGLLARKYYRCTHGAPACHSGTNQDLMMAASQCYTSHSHVMVVTLSLELWVWNQLVKRLLGRVGPASSFTYLSPIRWTPALVLSTAIPGDVAEASQILYRTHESV